MANEFAIAEGRRIEITQEQARQIRDMYQSIRQDFAKEVQSISHRTNISSVMRTQYLNSFQKDLESEITVLNARLEGLIKSNTLEIARAVVLDSNNLAKEMGFNGIFTNEYYIPNQVVNDLISGRLYEGKWSLSKAIWSDNQKKLSDIDQIIARGVAENRSTFDIAKDLERYVNPNARKDWSWSKVYPGSNKVVDYNAQRLARTMISHAYQESFVQSTKDNPFIESYRWLASGGDRMCDLCAERDGKIFAKDELPMDHPNGMCTFEVVIEQSYEDIARSLHDWINDEGDSELNEELDNYSETLGYNVKAWTANSEQVKNADNVTALTPSNSQVPVTLSNYDEAYREFREERANEINDIVPFEQMNNTLNQLVENNEFRVRFSADDSSVLESILNDGRLKTQFETNTSGGALNTDVREKASYNLFNTPSNTTAREYEKYGYLGSKDVSKDLASPFLYPYGDGVITLRKSEVVDRTTITFGDSLRNAVDGRYIMGSKVTSIDSTVCVGRPSLIDDYNKALTNNIAKYGIEDASSASGMTCGYLELQYHGDITLKDIESITVKKDMIDGIIENPNLLSIVKDSGIEFRYIEDGQIKIYEF